MAASAEAVSYSSNEGVFRTSSSASALASVEDDEGRRGGGSIRGDRNTHASISFGDRGGETPGEIQRTSSTSTTLLTGSMNDIDTDASTNANNNTDQSGAIMTPMAMTRSTSASASSSSPNTNSNTVHHRRAQIHMNMNIHPMNLLRLASSTVRTIATTILTMIQIILSFIVQFITVTFSNYMSTRQLYTVSIVLLCVHMLVQKILDYLPCLLMRGYLLLAGDDEDLNQLKLNGNGNHPKWGDATLSNAHGNTSASILKKIDLRDFVHTDSKWIASEIEAMERILEQILNSGAQSMNMDMKFEHSYGHGHGHANMSTSAGIGEFGQLEAEAEAEFLPMRIMNASSHILETPITSIMLPTTILSLFLLMTMTLFLMFHVMFQALLYLSSLFANGNGNGNGNGDHNNRHNRQRTPIPPDHFGSDMMWAAFGSGGALAFGGGINDHDHHHHHGTHGTSTFSPNSLALAGFILLLLLENLIPWIAFGVGIYLSFSVGGITWFLFTAVTYLFCFCLRHFRSRILEFLQDHNGPALD